MFSFVNTLEYNGADSRSGNLQVTLQFDFDSEDNSNYYNKYCNSIKWMCLGGWTDLFWQMNGCARMFCGGFPGFERLQPVSHIQEPGLENYGSRATE